MRWKFFFFLLFNNFFFFFAWFELHWMTGWTGWNNRFKWLCTSVKLTVFIDVERIKHKFLERNAKKTLQLFCTTTCLAFIKLWSLQNKYDVYFLCPISSMVSNFGLFLCGLLKLKKFTPFTFAQMGASTQFYFRWQ